MRKIICLISLCLLFALPLQAMAQTEPALKLSVTQEDMIYVAVALEGGVEGVSLGVTTEIDHLLLESVPSASKWSVKGLISDFNDKGQGVWLANNAQMLEGEIVVLAFRARGTESFETEIKCTLIVKNGTQEVGRYTTQTMLKVAGDPPKATEQTVPAATTEKTPATTEKIPATEPVASQSTEAAPIATQEPTSPETTAATTETVAVETVTEEPEKEAADANTWGIFLLAGVGAVVVVLVLRRKKRK